MSTGMADKQMNGRIGALDGLRAVAVIGVIWVHVWSFFGNIPCYFARIDWNKGIALAGVGVDLFFVISGFCMYLMYQRAGTEKTLRPVVRYGRFLLKRWTRIAPAFYAAVIVESLLFLWQFRVFPLKAFVAHLFFLNTFLSDNVLSPPFWSLATEWQFYLILPFIFFAASRPGVRRILILMLVCLLCRLWLYQQHAGDLRSGITVISDKIVYRFAEFGWGMLAAHFHHSRRGLPVWLRGWPGFFISCAVIVAGRAMMDTGVFNLLQGAAFILRSLGEPSMTLGFALLLLNVVHSRTLISSGLSARPMLFLGRISYSMYLWHWLIIAWLSRWWLPRFGVSNLSMQLNFLTGLSLVAIAGWISWYFLERPYFSKSAGKKTPGVPVVMAETVVPEIV